MMEVDDHNFEKEVLKSKKLVLVDFWSPWCRACSTMELVLERLAEEFRDKVEFRKLNIYQNPEIAKKYQIPATPTLIIFKDGKAVERAVGFRSDEVLINKLNSLL